MALPLLLEFWLELCRIWRDLASARLGLLTLQAVYLPVDSVLGEFLLAMLWSCFFFFFNLKINFTFLQL